MVKNCDRGLENVARGLQHFQARGYSFRSRLQMGLSTPLCD